MKVNKTVIDITNQFKKFKEYKLIVQKGVNKYEREIATWLLDNFGGNITCLAETPTIGKMPDALWNGVYWEFKSPKNIKRLDDRIRKAIHQIQEALVHNQNIHIKGGIVIDISEIKHTDREITHVIYDSLLKRAKFHTTVIIKKDEEIRKIIEIKKSTELTILKGQ